MLQSINGSVKKWVILPLFGLLILSFVVWGIADVFQGPTQQDTALQAGEIKLSGMHVQAEVQKNLDFIRRLTGRAITTEQAAEFGLIDRSIDGLVSRALTEQEANRLGIVISDDVIMKSIRRIPEFQTKDGAFDTEKFTNALKSVNASEAMFVADQRIAMARDQVKDVVQSNAYAPKLMLQALTAAAAQTRDFETYQIRFDRQPAPPAPDDAALQAYIAENARQFSTPETRSLSIIRLNAESVAASITINDAEAQAYYDANTDEFKQPERRSIQQVVADTQEAADKVVAAFRKTKDFPAAARDAGLSPTPLPDVTKDELPDELRTAAFTLAQGEVSAPVQSALGWHVMLVYKITPGTMADFATAKESIRNQLRLQQAQDRLFDESARLDDLVAGGATLEDIGSQLGVTVEKISNIDAQGRDASKQISDVLANNPQLLKTAFRLPEAGVSDVLSNGKNGYSIVRVDTVTPSTVRPFAAIKAEAIAAWQRDAQEKTAHETALKLIADIRGGMAFEKAAAAYGVEASRENGIANKDDGALISYIPAAFSADLFKLKEGDVTQFPTKDGIVVATFAKAHLPLAVAAAAPDAGLESNVLEQLKTELNAAFVESLKERYTVAIDRPAINKLFEKNTDEIDLEP
jgi:peptidyl-prolyl cis-trans isomerase D